MKKLIALLLTASVLISSGAAAAAAPLPMRLFETSTTTSDIEGEEVEEATETPTPGEAESEAPVDPSVTGNGEDYSGVNNPEDGDDVLNEIGGGTTSNNGEAGAAGGLGFFGSKFPDCQGHWAEQIIARCTELNYLDGYDDGNFYPDNPVTASQFAKIFSAWRGTFYQISEGYWATPYIINMLSSKIYENGDFDDYDAPMKREDVAKAVINSIKSEFFPSNLDKYKAMIPDIDKADSELSDYMVKAYIAGIITGYDDGSINPKGNVTRAEVLSIINRTVNPDSRIIPEAIANAAGEAAETYTYYNAAVQVRKSNNANSMNYRLHSRNSQHLTANDEVSGLRLVEEVQGANGFAFLMRYDLSDILKREDSLQSISLVVNHESWGTGDLGLYWYDKKVSSTDWNNAAYVQVTNGAAVAAADKTGYNAVVDNIMAQLPTWGDPDKATADKTEPFTKASYSGGQYIFELDINELKKHADEHNMVEFFMTTVNYDAYKLTEDDKPRCYVAGASAPQLYCTYDTGEEVSKSVRVLADTAQLEGGMLNLFGTGEDSYIENFRTDQKITFNFKASQPGKYKMTMYYSANVNSGGGTVSFDLNGSKFDHEFAQTGGWAMYVYEDLGEVDLKAGNNTLILTDKEVPNTYLINVKNIVFEKID